MNVDASVLNVACQGAIEWEENVSTLEDCHDQVEKSVNVLSRLLNVGCRDQIQRTLEDSHDQIEEAARFESRLLSVDRHGQIESR